MADPTIPPEDSPFATMSPRQALAQINIAIAYALSRKAIKSATANCSAAIFGG
jgi:hypothetical protein